MGAYDELTETEVTKHAAQLRNARQKVLEAKAAIVRLENHRTNMADTDIFGDDQTAVDAEVAKFAAIKTAIESNEPTTS